MKFDSTSTCNGPDNITAEELIAKMKDVMERLGPPLPEIRPSAFVPPGHFIKIPTDSPLFLEHHRTGHELMFVNPADYQVYQRALIEEQCKMFCAWKGGGPCLSSDCPRRGDK